MQRESSAQLKRREMLKRTEKLIDAVKLIELLETLENKEAVLNMEKAGEKWRFKCLVDGRLVVEEKSRNLSEMIDRALIKMNKQSE